MSLGTYTLIELETRVDKNVSSAYMLLYCDVDRFNLSGFSSERTVVVALVFR